MYQSVHNVNNHKNCYTIYSCVRTFHVGWVPISPSNKVLPNQLPDLLQGCRVFHCGQIARVAALAHGLNRAA